MLLSTFPGDQPNLSGRLIKKATGRAVIPAGGLWIRFPSAHASGARYGDPDNNAKYEREGDTSGDQGFAVASGDGQRSVHGFRVTQKPAKCKSGIPLNLLMGAYRTPSAGVHRGPRGTSGRALYTVESNEFLADVGVPADTRPTGSPGAEWRSRSREAVDRRPRLACCGLIAHQDGSNLAFEDGVICLILKATLGLIFII